MIQVEFAGSIGTKQNTKFIVYPFNIKNKDVVKSGTLKLDFKEEIIIVSVQVNENNCKTILSKEEKLELIKKIFSKLICKSKPIFKGIPNWKMAMYEFYEEESLEASKSLLDELLLYDVSKFDENDKLISYLLKSVNLVQNNVKNLEKGRRIYLHLTDHLSENELLIFANIFTNFLKNTYRDYKMEMEYSDQNDETTIYCFNENHKKYTVSKLFPNDDVMKDVLKQIQ